MKRLSKHSVLMAAVMAWVLLVVWIAGLVAQATDHPVNEIYRFRNGIKFGTAINAPTITGTTGTGSGAIVFPANSITLGSEVSGFAEKVNFCGDLTNATATYLGPGLAMLDGTPTDYVIGGAACSALDSTTEATADNPLSTLPTKIMGYRCKQSAAPGAGNSVVYTFRTALADAVTTDGGATTLTCTITGATATECRTIAGTTTNIAASAPVAIRAVPSYDASTQDARCVALVAWP